MTLIVKIAAGDTVTELASLSRWLSAEETMTGAVQVVTTANKPGTLAGGLPEAIAIALAPGGMATAAATVLITWLRHRSGSVKITGTRPDGAMFTLEAARVKNLDATEVEALAERITGDGGLAGQRDLANDTQWSGREVFGVSEQGEASAASDQ